MASGETKGPELEPLALVSTDELLDELRRRFPYGGIINLTRDLDADHVSRECLWWGGEAQAVGLAVLMQRKIEASAAGSPTLSDGE